MAVMPRELWTDERLDDLNQRIDGGFQEIKLEFRAVRAEMKAEFKTVRAEMKAEFRAVRAELKGEFQAFRVEFGGQIASLQRMTFQLFAGMIVTLVLGFGGMIVALLSQS
jgi:hypothetical protein